MGALLALILHVGKKQKVFGSSNVPLLTLGGQTAILAVTRIDASRLQGVKIRDIFGIFNWSGKTTGEGPIYYGFADGRLSIAEIAETFNADPQVIDDVPASEQAERRVIVIGTMPEVDTVQLNVDDHWHKMMWPTSWTIPESVAFNVFAFNRGSGSLTTGTLLRFDGMFNTEWLED